MIAFFQRLLMLHGNDAVKALLVDDEESVCLCRVEVRLLYCKESVCLFLTILSHLCCIVMHYFPHESNAQGRLQARSVSYGFVSCGV